MADKIDVSNLLDFSGVAQSVNQAIAQIQANIDTLNIAVELDGSKAEAEAERLKSKAGEIAKAAQSAMSGLQTTVNAAGSIYQTAQGGIENLQDLGEVAFQALTLAVGGFTVGMNLASLATTAFGVTLSATGIGAAVAGIGLMIGAMAGLSGAMDTGKEKTLGFGNALKSAIPDVDLWGEAWEKAKTHLADTEDILSKSGLSMSVIDEEIQAAQEGINAILSTAAEERRALREDEIAQIEGYNKRIAELQGEQRSIYQAQQDVVQAKIEAAMIAGGLDVEDIATLSKETIEQYEHTLDYLEKDYSAEILRIIQELGSAESEERTKRLEAAKQSLEMQKFFAIKKREENFALLEEGADQMLELQSSVLSQLLNNTQATDEELQQAWNSFVTGTDAAAYATAKAWFDAQVAIVESGGAISLESRKTAERILNAFEWLPKEMRAEGTETLRNLMSGFEDQIPELQNMSELSAEQIIRAYRDYMVLQPSSDVMAGLGANTMQGLVNGADSKNGELSGAGAAAAQSVVDGAGGKQGDMASIGGNMVSGLWSGINGATEWLHQKINGFVSSLPEWAKKLLGIHSPSKVMRDQVGAMIAKGVAVGIEENAGDVASKFHEMLEKLNAQRDFDLISEAEYYRQLEKLRDDYLTEGSDKWLQYTKQIYDYQKQTEDGVKQQAKAAYEVILQEAEENVSKIEALIDRMADKLKSRADLTESITLKEGGVETVIPMLSSWEDDVAFLAQYRDALVSAKNRLGGLPDGLFSILADMNPDEGLAYANLLNHATDAQLADYVAGWEENQRLSDEVAQIIYGDNLSAAQQTADSLSAQVRDALVALGEDVPEDFFTIGDLSAEQFGKGFEQSLQEEFDRIRLKVAAFQQEIMLGFQTDAARTGAQAGQVVNNNGNTFQNTITVTAQGTSPRATAQAIQNQMTMQRMLFA